MHEYFVSLIEHFTRQYKDLKVIASLSVETKLNDNLLSIFFLAFLCNILIYLAVEEYKSNKHELGKYLGIIFGVVVFIVCAIILVYNIISIPRIKKERNCGLLGM